MRRDRVGIVRFTYIDTRSITFVESRPVLLCYENINTDNAWISLVDEITFKLAEEAEDAPTATAILGPFFRADTPYRKNGDNIVKGVPDGEMAFMHGRVIDFTTKKPLVGATVEVWQAATNGLYEQQDPNQEEFNLRGKFKTDEEGRYNFYCLRPTPYPVPDDGMFRYLSRVMWFGRCLNADIC